MHTVAGICGLDTKAGRRGEPAQCCSGASEEKCGNLPLHANRRSPVKLVDPWQNDSPVSTQVPANRSITYASLPQLHPGEQAELVAQQPSRWVIEIHIASLPAQTALCAEDPEPVDGETKCRGGVDRPVRGCPVVVWVSRGGLGAA